MRNANGFAGSTLFIEPVDTKAQFCNAAELRCWLTIGVPMTHSPRPGGVHFNSKRRSKASLADDAALASDHGKRLVLAWSFWSEYIPLMTLSHTSAHVSLVPSSFSRE